MAAGEKKTILSLPLKIILTEEGSNFFIRQNKKLLKFKLADNVEEYGISLEQFTPSTIQRLLLIDYISKIEISKPEFVTSRQETMDLSKLIVYSVLYRQYDSYIFHQILSSDVIKKWNRLNPANIIDEKTHINENFLSSVLKKNEKIIFAAKQEILSPLYTFINKNTSLLPEEKNIQLLLSEKFMNNLRPFTWFIITKFRDADGFDTILRTIRSSLTEYMDKAKIAEYISLMLMELVVSAENTNLRKEVTNMYKGAVDPNTVMFDPSIRKKAIAELARRHELVFLSWKLGGGNSSIGTQGKLQITIYNKDNQTDTVREIINDKKNADLKKKSLIDFYKEIPEGEEDTNLGMYYLSYLSEACDKVNVKFESMANQFRDSDLTVINLSFNSLNPPYMKNRPIVRAFTIFALFPLFAGLLPSCTQGKPSRRSSVVQLVLVETENRTFAERLSFFAFFDDPDGAYDFGSIRIVHDKTGLEWTILPDDAEVRLRGADRWTGSAGLAGPGDAPFPEGHYSVTVSDLAGNEAPGSFTLVRPPFPERSPAVFSVRGEEWELVRNSDSRGFNRSFLLLSDAEGKLLYSYRVADTAQVRVSGTLASLEALAKDTVTVRCYTENESGSAGVLLIPVNIR